MLILFPDEVLGAQSIGRRLIGYRRGAGRVRGWQDGTFCAHMRRHGAWLPFILGVTPHGKRQS